MNEVLELMEKRTSVRRFTNEPVSDADRKAIYDAIAASPSACNMQRFSVIEVQNKKKKAELAKICDNQPFIADGEMVLIFCTNTRRHYELHALSHLEFVRPTLADFYLAFCDTMIAAENAVIAAESLGIGSCYIGDVIENYERMKELFCIPDGVNPVAMLVMGYKNDFHPKPKRFTAEELISIDEYQNDSLSMMVNKMSSELTEEEKEEKAFTHVDAIMKNKMGAPFFQEMNRSFRLMLKEYMDFKEE